MMPSPDRPSRCSRRSRSKPGEVAPTSRSRAPGRSRRRRANASSSCGTRLLAFRFPKQPTSGSPSTSAGATVRHRPRRMRDAPDRPLVPGRARPLLDVARVDDQAVARSSTSPASGKSLGPALPERRDALVEHAVAEQPADDAALALHRVEVAVAVAPADRQPGDEVVEDELVQDDDARPLAQRVDDPAVRVRVVADVVEREVGAARRARVRRAGRPRRRSARERGQRAARCSRRSPSAPGGIGE